MPKPSPPPSSNRSRPLWAWGEASDKLGPQGLWRALSPAQLFVTSFLLLIGAGTVGFQVLPGLYTGPPLG